MIPTESETEVSTSSEVSKLSEADLKTVLQIALAGQEEADRRK